MISEATKARFAKEVAKYPDAQKQSAVMACLSIVQQEQGHVSAESERECLGACADSPVMLVNDRNMCSFMSVERLEALVEGLRNAEGKA